METASRPKVYLSYPRRETEWTRRFAEALKSEDVEVWFDVEQIPAGQRWEELAERALRESSVIVTIITADLAQAPSLYFELGVAASSSKTIVPIVPKDLDPSRLPPPLRARQWLVKSSPTETARRLAGQLKAQHVPA